SELEDVASELVELVFARFSGDSAADQGARRSPQPGSSARLAAYAGTGDFHSNHSRDDTMTLSSSAKCRKCRPTGPLEVSGGRSTG
ncbi:hypothetical protein THAOC_28404, partial [Thalassiosira oceanica]